MSDRPFKDVVIGGVTYTITVMGAIEGRKIWFKIAAALSGGIKNVGDINSISDATLGDAGAILHGALMALGEEDFAAVCDAMANCTEVVIGPNQKLPLSQLFDNQFAGKYWTMLQWLYRAAEVNFADFLSVFKGRLGEKFQQIVTQSRSSSPKA